MFMKKILLMFMMCFSFIAANAQIATENSKVFDNISIGVTAGVSTPMDFNSMFPLNPNFGLKLQKDFTPVFGLQLEGLAILNDNHFTDIKTMVKATNVGVNGVFNLSNAIWGYKGTPRTFEVAAVAGLGWLHEWNSSENSLTGKTGLDLIFNLGKKKAHSIVITPAVYWNLHKYDAIQFTKEGAQIAVNLTYVYHFKTSNGTHHFKTYDVGAMIGEINRLNEELAKKPTEVVKYVEVIKTDTIRNNIMVPSTYVIQFAKNSAILSNEAKSILNGINGSVNITASASPEGTKEYNQILSERRATAVADYLTNRGIKVNSFKGIGCIDNNSNRIAIITSY